MIKRILILEDDESLRLVISKALSRAGFEVRSTATPQTAIERMASGDADALVADVLLGRDNFLDRMDEVRRVRPDAPIVIMSAQTTAATAIHATKGGAFEYLPKPFDLNDLVDVLNRALEVQQASPTKNELGFAGLIGRSSAMQTAFRTIGRLSQNAFPVLFVGPEGSGRAAAARVLHREGGLTGPLIEMGPTQFDEEANKHLNRTDQATLLLRRADDWSDRAIALTLEHLERETRDGPRLLTTVSANVRDRLPDQLIDRLAIGLVDIPPLRLRGDDRALLFEHFLAQVAKSDFQLNDDAREFINAQGWPGEVQQLRRTAERLVAQGRRGPLTADNVRAAMDAPRPIDPDTALSDAASRYFSILQGQGEPDIAARAQSALDAGLIRAALDASSGVRQDAAKRLGMNRNTFSKRISDLEARGESDV